MVAKKQVSYVLMDGDGDVIMDENCEGDYYEMRFDTIKEARRARKEWTGKMSFPIYEAGIFKETREEVE